ncbi:MAG: FHA domain-containing protein, partial [Anaerolineales bacterium]|nr:FHA domain-containing protein [Anaerolineales bacterium]
INFSNPFAIQNINGVSRFDYIKESLLNWAAQPLATSPDDLSILTNDGMELTHQDDKNNYIAILEKYKPERRETESNFNVLARAIEIASDPVDQQGMKRVVLFYTSQPTSDEFAAIDSLISQAKDQQVMVYTILVSSPAFFLTAGASTLQTLSTETGGLLLPFSGEEPLPDLGQLLLPLRSTYLVKYQSQIVTPGIHTLEVSISTTLGENVGLRDFFLDVQPPNPVFVSPPRSITRKLPESSSNASEDQIYQPETFPLQILVEFPDKHPRELEELIIRVDGEIVDHKNTPPYDLFSWDLRSYESSAIHYLSIEAVDSLGLSRLSVETPIEVKLEVPPPNIYEILSKNGPAFAGLAVILLLGISLFTLVFRGKIQPRDRNDFTQLIKNISRGFIPDMIIKKHKSGKRNSSDPLPESKILSYRLIPINDVSRLLFPSPIIVGKSELLLGNNKSEDVFHIDHPSVIKEHARITIYPEGDYKITDLGSAAGTWINYQQTLRADPQILKDGDIINIGEACFRFQVIEKMEASSISKEKTN